MNRKYVALLVAALALGSSRANAAAVLVGYPAPGGGSVTSSSGAPGVGTGDITTPDGPVGRTFTYTGFNALAGGYSQLWWGPTSIFGPLSDGTSQTFNFTSETGNEAIFSGANNWTFATAFGSVSAPVRYELKTYDLTGAAIALEPFASVTAPGSLGVLLNVTPYLSTGFKADFVFEAFNGSTWVGVDQFYNQFNTLCSVNCVSKSVNAQFFAELVDPAAVPEPASLMLLGGGLLVAVRRIRKQRLA